MTDATETRGWWSETPRWARIGLVAFAAIVVALAAIVAVRVLTRAPSIPLGETAAADLRPGACLAERGLDLEVYTVVPCDTPHPLQVFATADLRIDEVAGYSSSPAVLAAFGDAVCERYLEYRLFLAADLDKLAHEARALAVPTIEEYEAGDSEALCVIASESGEDLTADVYRPMP